MSKAKTKNMIRRIVDAAMTVLLLCLMAYQVTGEVLHEWIGMGMTALVIFHQILNRKWYGALLKGKYNAYRALTAAINILLLCSFALTAFCGMSMSGHAVPFLYGMAPVSFARQMHLSVSHWAFVLMGLHLGLHIPAMAAGLKLNDKTKTLLACVFACIGGIGLWLFLRSGIPNYLFFRVPFAFLDYEKAGALVFLENLLMLSFWGFTGAQAALICRNTAKKDEKKKSPLIPAAAIMAAVIIGIVLMLLFPSADGQGSFGTTNWSAQQSDAVQTPAPDGKQESSQEEHTAAKPNSSPAEDSVPEGDGFVLIQGGSFLMGSPETENWRIEDEVLHEVTVSAFYIDPYETTQEEYLRIMGQNPSAFSGEYLPVESISWLDAILFSNAKSVDAGLTPVYFISDGRVEWDRSANGYRLPTEAEWEYACRAGTETPFNTEHSLDADDANFYGHYPYEIEENYFNDSVLEARPGLYRQTTVTVGSFYESRWGLYDMHGNVNEWCWDYYGEYDMQNTTDPAGVTSGTRHVYRGGGWNDFGKNMRSAYRAAGQSDLKAANLGVRLVRNADASMPESVIADETVPAERNGGRFGQSLTAIAKLAPDAVMGEGLSVHYSGGSTLESDVAAWLDANGIERK